MARKTKGSSSSGSPRKGRPTGTKQGIREAPSRAAPRRAVLFNASDRASILGAIFAANPSPSNSDRILRHVGLAVADYRRATAEDSHRQPAKSALKKERKRIAKALGDCAGAIAGASRHTRESLIIQMVVRVMREPLDSPYALDAAERAMAARLLEFVMEMDALREDADRSVRVLEAAAGAHGGRRRDTAREILGLTLALVWQTNTGKAPTLTDANLTYLGFVQAVCYAARLDCADRAAREGLAAWKSRGRALA